MERIINGESISIYIPTYDEIVKNTISVLLNTDEEIDWIVNKLQQNISDTIQQYPKLIDFFTEVVKMINKDWLYEFVSYAELRIIYDQILCIWKYHVYRNEADFYENEI